MMGVSRSATVVCAYLIAEHNMSARDAIAFVRSARGVARPNVGFERQLEQYAKQLAWRDTPSTLTSSTSSSSSSRVALIQDRLRRILEGSTAASSTRGVVNSSKRLPSRTVAHS
jgi:hypothetical protein